MKPFARIRSSIAAVTLQGLAIGCSFLGAQGATFTLELPVQPKES